LMPKTLHILKSLYELDIVEEAVLLDWGSKPSKKYVSKEESVKIIKEAQPFLTWLAEAEEDSDDDSEDQDDEVEIIYSTTDKVGEVTVETPKPTKPAVQPSAVNGKPPAVEEEDDDIDIDDI